VRLLANDLSVLCLTPSPDSNRITGGLDQKNVIAKKRTDTYVVTIKENTTKVCQEEHDCHGIQD